MSRPDTSDMTISDILSIEPEEITRSAAVPLEFVPDDAAISEHFAAEMIGLIEENNRQGRPSSLILPVGPRGGYPLFVDAVRKKSLDLSRTTFFFMDEYLDEDGGYIPPDNPLSFHGFVRDALIGPLAGSPGFDPVRVRFPDPADTGAYAGAMERAGGIDLVLAGVGIDGHVAFNEPEPEMGADAYAELPTRVVMLSAQTRTVNAVMEAGGAVDLIPRAAVTVGMAEILSARRIVVFMNRPWQKAAVRKFLFGEITAAFPVSILRAHHGLSVVITAEVAERPLP